MLQPQERISRTPICTVLQTKPYSRIRADTLSHKTIRVMRISSSVIRSRGAVVLFPMDLINDFAPIFDTGEVSSPLANSQSVTPF